MKLKVVALFALVSLGACKTTEPMYYYGEYSQVVYGYFKADEMSITQQIDALTLIIMVAESTGKPVAPGVHAHLGMLYLESGQSEQGFFHLNQEKILFPESTGYIDFLLLSAGESA